MVNINHSDNINGCSSTDPQEELSNEFGQKVTIDDLSASDESRSCPVDIEIRVTKTGCLSDVEKFIESMREYISNKSDTIRNCRSFLLDETSNFLHSADRLIVSCPKVADGLPLKCSPEQLKSARFHLYAVKRFGAMAEEISLDDAGETTALGSHQWEIPCMEFDNLWETLIFDQPIKNELLIFVNSLMEISQAGADISIIPLNRLILLHGPPGTGKTTLCRALAQKLAIRTQNRYKRSVLVEVNSHSLFSKWFSESGKLIQKLFTRIEELAEQPTWLVFVLIDEVESLTMGRNAVFSGSDPSDSVRAVNAVLTQLDKIKHFPNVLIFCTSNLEKALDPAFVDRADLVRKIGNPAHSAIQSILVSGIEELQRIKLIELNSDKDGWDEQKQKKLANLVSRCAGISLSGRALRKLPMLAYSEARSASLGPPPVSFDSYLDSFAHIISSPEFQCFFEQNL